MVCHAAKVDCSALFTLIRDLFYMDGAELVFEALRLTGWKFASWLYHIDADELVFAGDDVNNA